MDQQPLLDWESSIIREINSLFFDEADDRLRTCADKLAVELTPTMALDCSDFYLQMFTDLGKFNQVSAEKALISCVRIPNFIATCSTLAVARAVSPHIPKKGTK